ncbi:hypothetical protein FF38_06881 [Lucilia cuprina]|uniref:WW domain-containing protein n=1 Tax=Lucilia cuprina TaxID=7375 RepID=A0A0L0CGC0_LUCCU|nr:hypothetical protein CVS40_9175 [Lucilia cuprina]KNC31438.1 hypothetical protein FF38_06881 [Lucilia cuprina]
MADSGGRQYQKLPPGWDCKYDQTTGNCYYINYITKAMQLEDPRSTRYRPLQNERCSNESIAMHSFHGPGGSPYHVYPTNNMPAMRAFQTPNSSLHHMSTSPLLTSSRTQLINDMSPIPAPKSQFAQAPRTVNMSRRSTIQETSFTNQIDTDAVVHKIQNMFPTASENHIRLLLKKYYNREAVVISALQVEKHPVTMPGPYVTPPAQRHLFHSNSAIHMTPPSRRFDTGSHLRGLDYTCYSRTASPVPPGRLGSVISINSGGHGIMGHMAVPPYQASPRFGDQMRCSPKPHSSPKMKLRYMKTIFPKADETLLLDVLANSDNNVQKASEKLLTLGYIKKDFAPPPKLTNRPQNEMNGGVKPTIEDEIKIIPLRPKEYTEEEKEAIKLQLKEKYPQIVDHILVMALESVNYAEDRAMQILQIVKEEEEQQKQKTPKLTHTTIMDYKQDELDGLGHISGRVSSKPLTSILKSTDANLRKEIISNPANPEFKDDKTDTTNINNINDNEIIIPSVSSILKLSSVTMSTKSILDRYRTNNKISANDFIRGTYPVTAILWDKLSLHSRDKSDTLKHSHRDQTDAATDKLCKDFKSLMGRIQTNGPNASLAKGANEGLLLADYVTWNGANPDFCQGQRNLANGADSNMRSERAYKAFGHNADLCKGPQSSLAKGSIYTQQNTANANKSIDIICN